MIERLQIVLDLVVSHLGQALHEVVQRVRVKHPLRFAKQLAASFVFVHLALPAHALDLKDYWPAPAENRQLIIQTRASQGGNVWFGTTHRYVNRGQVRSHDVLRLDDFGPGGWIDAWELRPEGADMLEVGDQFPGIHKVYEVGKEFTWGGIQNVGDVIVRQVHVDVAASTGETAGPHNWGTAILTIEEFLLSFTNLGGMQFSDVVVVQMFQSFCINAQCAWPSGQATWVTRHWMAPGVGIIQTQYLQAPGQTFDPPRIDYAIGILETWETP